MDLSDREGVNLRLDGTVVDVSRGKDDFKALDNNKEPFNGTQANKEHPKTSQNRSYDTVSLESISKEGDGEGECTPNVAETDSLELEKQEGKNVVNLSVSQDVRPRNKNAINGYETCVENKVTIKPGPSEGAQYLLSEDEPSTVTHLLFKMGEEISENPDHNNKQSFADFQERNIDAPYDSKISNKNHPLKNNDRLDGSSNKAETDSPKHHLIYGLTETPPLHYLFFFAIQQACLAISTPLGTTAIIAQAVCAKDDLELKVRILSSTMAMMGLSTFLMTTVGVKLPIFQGPAPSYIIPLIVLMSLPEFACPEAFWARDPVTNNSVLMAMVSANNTGILQRVFQSTNISTSNPRLDKVNADLLSDTSGDVYLIPNRDVSLIRLQAYAGSLMVAGVFHFVVGITGITGIIVRYVGPVTIVPVVLLFGIYIHTVVVMFSETNWVVAVLTAGTCILFGLVLGDRKMPIPIWTPRKGFRLVWTYGHQIFAILIALFLGWLVSFIMTESGALSSDPHNIQFNARTDARGEVIAQTNWFILPYPGQFGPPGFSGAALLTFLISTIISILDSIGDYYATARVARAPPPPSYALNRGVAVEGAMSILSGSFGCGHATVSYSENIGAIGLSRVASRCVFQIVGAIYFLLAVIGKVGAVFVTIPDAVIGGSQIVTFGILIGVILSYLHLVDLQTTRNVSIIGIAVLLGMMLPHWVKKSPQGTINTGSPNLDNVITVCLSNPSVVGGIFAFVLDNLVPGTLQERGIPESDTLVTNKVNLPDTVETTNNVEDQKYYAKPGGKDIEVRVDKIEYEFDKTLEVAEERDTAACAEAQGSDGGRGREAAGRRSWYRGTRQRRGERARGSRTPQLVQRHRAAPGGEGERQQDTAAGTEAQGSDGVRGREAEGRRRALRQRRGEQANEWQRDGRSWYRGTGQRRGRGRVAAGRPQVEQSPTAAVRERASEWQRDGRSRC
ncbi:solute carrier family 23 member 2 [Plakobranchus ocellatus]|uniref:Solute carrier family 23 member 2 n=1 Tax=Plakobranchus ocellatus TaxID=259542 RepID=A0AAV4DZB6_9GAST|nr:solute carrier family 23 member 2 [Plakobranchus ocellatus]